jgi:hypothetical protein
MRLREQTLFDALGFGCSVVTYSLVTTPLTIPGT